MTTIHSRYREAPPVYTDKNPDSFRTAPTLRRAIDSGSCLDSADLSYLYLENSDLHGGKFHDADFSHADLGHANLRSTSFYGANLRYTNFLGADLRGANFTNAEVNYAQFYGAILEEVIGFDACLARINILPEGDIIGWKTTRGGILIKLLIPADAKRSHATGRKCRTNKAKVLEILSPEGEPRSRAVSMHDSSFCYTVGAVVEPVNVFDPDPLRECASGIHFFITRSEAENY